MKSFKAALLLLPSVMRAALLWFRLRNHQQYEISLAALNGRIDDLEESHHMARSNGNSHTAIDFLLRLNSARKDRDALSAAYLELTGRDAGGDSERDLHPVEAGVVAQPKVD